MSSKIPLFGAIYLWPLGEKTGKSGWPVAYVAWQRRSRSWFHYAFQTFLGATGMPAMALRVSTMHRAQSPSS